MTIHAIDVNEGLPVTRPLLASWGIKAWRNAGAFALAYFLAARAGQFIIYDPIPFTMLWVPSGLFVGVLLCSSPRRWPLFIAAAALANVGFNLSLDRNLPTGLGFFTADCLEAVVGAWLATRLAGVRLESRIGARELLVTLGAACILSPALGAAVGATVAGIYCGAGDWPNAWFSWWSGDSLGVVTAGIFLVAAHRYGRGYLRSLWGMRMVEFAAVLALLLGQALWLFGDIGRFDYYCILIPGLLWIAMRFRVIMVCFAGIVLSIFSAAYIIHVSPVGVAPAEIIIHLQAQRMFLVVVVSTLIILSSYREFRNRAEAKLRESEERYRQVFDNMADGLAVYSAVDHGHDFVFVDLNPAGQVMSKVPKEVTIGRRLTELFPAVGELGLLDVLRRVHESGKPERLSLRRYADERIVQWVENYVFRLPTGHVCALYADTTGRKQAELEAQEAGRKVQALAKELSMSRERERRVIADDLHDGPVQLVAIATLMIEGLARQGRPFEEYAPCLDMLRNALGMLRFTIADLSPLALKGADLEQALMSLARDTIIQYSMDVEVSCAALVDLTEDAKSLLYRAARELLVNAVKHGRASRARILAEASEVDLTLTVEDNGVGFDSNRMEFTVHAYGLAGLQDVARSLGGEAGRGVDARGRGACGAGPAPGLPVFLRRGVSTEPGIFASFSGPEATTMCRPALHAVGRETT